MREVERALVVEDDRDHRELVVEILGRRGWAVKACGSSVDAIELIRGWQPDLVVLDVCLPDGDALEVLSRVTDLVPAPTVVVVSGSAGPEAGVRLGAGGVRAYVPKPLSRERLDQAIDESLTEAPDLRPHIRASVGHRSLHEVEGEVRETMIDEALGRVEGSRRGAARLLDVSRQLLQHVLRKRDS